MQPGGRTIAIGSPFGLGGTHGVTGCWSIAGKLPDGRTIAPEAVLGPPEAGKKLVIVGDTETTDGMADKVSGADLLVIEATFLQRDAAMARDYGHLTAAEAASLAAASDVKQLVLTHISGRYRDEEILAEAVQAFANSLIATDFTTLTV